MFCPDCGAENLRGQKFCTRCGTNLVVIERAREVVSEMTTSAPAPQFEHPNILRIIALISILGFMFVTIGTIITMAIDGGRTPIPVFFALGGFGALVFICYYLLKLINPATKAENRKPTPAMAYAPPVVRGATNRGLNEPAVSYQSIVEDPTQQFEAERRVK